MLFDLFWSYTPFSPIEFHRDVTWPHHKASTFGKTTPLEDNPSWFHTIPSWWIIVFPADCLTHLTPAHSPGLQKKKKMSLIYYSNLWSLTCQYIWICIVGCQNPVTVWQWSKLWPHLPMYFRSFIGTNMAPIIPFVTGILVSGRLKIREDWKTTGSSQMTAKLPTYNRAMKKKPGCLGYSEDEILPIYVGIISNNEIRIPIKQPGFNGK